MYRSEILRNRQANYFNTFSKDFKKYSGVKTAFIKSLLDRNISPIVSDADVIWMKDPKEFFKRGSLAKADILISNDCIDVPADEKDNGGCAVGTSFFFLEKRVFVVVAAVFILSPLFG